MITSNSSRLSSAWTPQSPSSSRSRSTRPLSTWSTRHVRSQRLLPRGRSWSRWSRTSRARRCSLSSALLVRCLGGIVIEEEEKNEEDAGREEEGGSFATAYACARGSPELAPATLQAVVCAALRSVLCPANDVDEITSHTSALSLPAPELGPPITVPRALCSNCSERLPDQMPFTCQHIDLCDRAPIPSSCLRLTHKNASMPLYRGATAALCPVCRREETHP